MSKKVTLPVRYFHVRYWDDQYDDLATKGGHTVAYRRRGSILEYALAHCSEKDNYCKKVGRELAVKRLEAGQFFTQKLGSDITPSEFFAQMYEIEDYVGSEQDDECPFDENGNYRFEFEDDPPVEVVPAKQETIEIMP